MINYSEVSLISFTEQNRLSSDVNCNIAIPYIMLGSQATDRMGDDVISLLMDMTSNS